LERVGCWTIISRCNHYKGSAFVDPTGADPKHFHLIAPYEPDSRKWNRTRWVDRYTGSKWHVTTIGEHGTRNAARVSTYGEITKSYAVHPESKSASSDAKACSKEYRGLLHRRRIAIASLHHVGKESNQLEDVQSGTVHNLDEVYTEYRSRHREIIQALRSTKIRQLLRLTGLSRS